MSEGVFVFWCDVIEGGKSQFLFYYMTKSDAAQIEKGFKLLMKEEKRKQRKSGKFLIDGEMLGELAVMPESLRRKNEQTKTFSMVQKICYSR